MDIPHLVAALICEHPDVVKRGPAKRYRAAVAVARYRGQWLLGLSKSPDDRYFKWCFPGGGVDDGETAEAAAVRECKEETNARCRAIGQPFDLPNVPGVAFVPCLITAKPNLISKADEFVSLGLFTEREIRKLRNVYKNVFELIKYAKRHR